MNSAITVKTPQDIKILRRAGEKHSRILAELYEQSEPGCSLRELDERARELIAEAGGSPAFLNYRPAGAPRPFPASICVSVNDRIVHGIPNETDYCLQEGDLVSVDLGFNFQNMITDSAFTKLVGSARRDSDSELVKANREALKQGVGAVRAGGHIGDIGAAIERYVSSTPFFIIKHLAGHGVGYDVHEPPFVPNTGRIGRGLKMPAGAVLAIEPMLSIGSDEIVQERDGFTYSTYDGSNSAHFEQTVLVTEDGAEILTPLGFLN